MQQEYVKERNNAMYFASYTHPALMDRIAKAGIPSKTVSVEYQKTVSFAVTSAALMQYVNRRFRNALKLVAQNVKNNVATATDYILMANCTIALNNTPQSNQDALDCINKAKAIAPNDINIFKAEILAKLRLKDNASAANLLKEYCEKLDLMEKDCSDIRSGDTWNAQTKFIRNERTWASDMITKLKGM